MTEGISKETIKNHIERLSGCSRYHDRAVELSFCYKLLRECAELDPWLPIDENTPKDKTLLLAYKLADGTWYKWAGFVNSCWNLPPTHYKLLLDDPK